MKRFYLSLLAVIYLTIILLLGCVYLASHFHSILGVLPVPAIIVTAAFVIGYIIDIRELDR